MASRLVLPGQRQGGRPERRDQPLEPLLAGRVEQEPGEAEVVLDDQQDPVARPDVVAVVADLVDQLGSAVRLGGRRPPAAGRGGRGSRSIGPAVWPGSVGAGGRPAAAVYVCGRYRVNVLPLPGRARQPDLAAQQPRQLAADRQAQAGAAVLAAGRAVRLLERLEDDLLLVRRRCRCRCR